MITIKQKILLCLPVFAAIFLCSCYQPEGENFTVVQQPDGSGITIDLESHGDTIFLDQNTYLDFRLKGSTGLRQYDVYLNGSFSFSTAIVYESNPFYLNVEPLGTGIHSLEIRAHVKSYSGSLADKFDAEALVVSRAFILVVDLVAPDPRTVSIDTTQGNVMLSWNPYTKWNFGSYRIVKCPGQYSYGTDCQYFSIDDAGETRWTDSSFVGGPAAYKIEIRTSAHTIESNAISIYSKLGTVLELLPDKKMRLRWTQSNYYRNVASVRIVSQGIELKATTDLTDTVVVKDNACAFGKKYDKVFEIVVEGKTGVVFRQNVAFAYGQLIDDDYSAYLSHVQYNEALHRYFIVCNHYQNPHLTAYDNDFNALSDKRYNIRRFSLSENAQWMYADFNSSSGYIYRVEPQTLDTSKTFSVWQTFNGTLSSKIDVSNTNQVAYAHTRGHAIHQQPGGEVLRWRKVGGAGVALSGDGKYYFDYDEIYEVDGGALTLVGTLPPATNPYFVGFRNDKPYELIIFEDDIIRIVSIPDMTERTIGAVQASTFWGPVMYDPVSGWLLFQDLSHAFNMVHVDTGETFKPKLAEDVRRLFLANGRLFSGQGYMADISLIKSL